MASLVKTLSLAALCSTVLAAPSQKTIKTTADPGFPILQPLPFNGTVPGVNYDLIAKLRDTPNVVTRIALLEDTAFKFDYIKPPTEIPFSQLKGKGGTIVNAFGITMPALVGNGMAMSMAFTEPCGFNTPHTHPRATELAVVVKGRMISEFVAETGARKIRNEHDTYSMVVFPQGALHLEFNPDCEEMIFLAAFNSEDPGINTPGESLFFLDDDFVGLALGLEFLPGADIDKYRNLVPATLAQGVETCLKRCGIKKNEVSEVAEVSDL
ncbi:spherulin-1A [Thozetella sp. PMI_491]|nr:spherulin-1A [Thozetella sp. PMI_491]